MFYIQENDKPNFIEKTFNIIRLEDNIIKIPNIDDERIAKKLLTKIKKNSNSNKIILSKKTKKNLILVNYLNQNSMKIMNGNLLEEMLIQELLKYIIEKKQLSNIKLSILINDFTDLEVENIKELALEYKKINIITNHPEKMKNIEKQLSTKYGIMILVENNKKRSLLKSEVILNIDFPEELINKYIINESAIILNLKNKTKINKKRFNGLVINDYEISYENQENIDLEKYCLKDVYESKIYNKKDFKKIIKSDSVKITKLVLNNGSI